MVKNAAQVVQAVPLIEGKVNVGAGTYTAISLIHAEEDTTITLAWGQSYDISEGDDRAYSGEFTVVSGTVTYE